MIEKVPMPTDPESGVPYPILITPDDVPPRGLGLRELRDDYDHSWFTHNNPCLQGQGGRALHYSLGQVLPRWKHEIKNQRYLEPPLPAKDDANEQFRLAAAGCARLIGPYAIDVTSDDWTTPVLMTPEQYDWLTDPRRMHIEGNTPRRAQTTRIHLGKFFAVHALSQDFGQIITPKVIKDFLHTEDPVRKTELGNLLLREGVAAAVEPLNAVKAQLADTYDLPQIKGIDLARKLRKFFPKQRFGDYYGVLTARLLEVEFQWG
jgi:hypothetical protein